MADTIKDGGPAYPSQWDDKDNEGMSLRDALAMNAPVTWADVHEQVGWRGDKGPLTDSERGTLWAVMARLRYEYADAMIAAREAKTDGRSDA